jgi:hypothetical protein
MFSENTVFVTTPPPEEMMLIVRFVLPGPALLVAEMMATFVPAVRGIPDITPLVVLMLAHEGKFEAPNEVGAFDAAIW